MPVTGLGDAAAAIATVGGKVAMLAISAVLSELL